MTKSELRKLMRCELSAVSAYEKNVASEKACEQFLEFAFRNNFDIVLSYADMRNEISPEKINCGLMRMKKSVALPRVVSGTSRMNFYILDNEINMSAQLERGAFGISEPFENKEKIFSAKNFSGRKICVVVPGVAFGKRGQRLGHGMGFYDIYLSVLKKECMQNGSSLFLAGLCFDFQIKENIPADENDIFMDCVFSEKKSYFFESTE